MLSKYKVGGYLKKPRMYQQRTVPGSKYATWFAHIGMPVGCGGKNGNRCGHNVISHTHAMTNVTTCSINTPKTNYRC